MENQGKLTLSVAPHVSSGDSTSKIMLFVVLALLPVMGVSIYTFGMRAAAMYAVTIAFCLIFETLFNMITKRENSINDFSALVTAILLTMNLPVSAPFWIAGVGSFVAIVVSKMLFGGLGGNPFNPALVARIFLLISFPVQMTAWTIDGKSAATVLGSSKMHLQNADSLVGYDIPALSETFLGATAGSIGETSAIAILIGGIFLIATRVITWHIPVTFIGTVFLLTLGHSIAHPGTVLPPLTHITSGGLMLGAFFMATDYSTSPLFPKGKIIFGIGCGVLTVVIRMFGGYPEGVAFAILIMNAITPLLDRYLRPVVYGEQ